MFDDHGDAYFVDDLDLDLDLDHGDTYVSEIVPIETVRAAFPPRTRIRRGGRLGFVTDVGELRGQPVVYVCWDRTPDDDPATPVRREAVPPSFLVAVTS